MKRIVNTSPGKRAMKIIGYAVGSVIAILLLFILFVEMRWDAKDGRPAPLLIAPKDSASIARGEYIFRYQAQCWECHQSTSGPQKGEQAGGQLFDLTNVGPGFGKLYSRNLTADSATGLGGCPDVVVTMPVMYFSGGGAFGSALQPTRMPAEMSATETTMKRIMTSHA